MYFSPLSLFVCAMVGMRGWNANWGACYYNLSSLVVFLNRVSLSRLGVICSLSSSLLLIVESCVGIYFFPFLGAGEACGWMDGWMDGGVSRGVER